MPYFTVQVSPSEPRANEPIVITVRTWADAEHSLPTAAGDVTTVLAGSLDGLLVVGRVGWSDIPIHLAEVEPPNRFAATIMLGAGDWTLVAFPDRSGWADPAVPSGYPDVIPLAVREPGPPPQVTILALVGLLVLVIAATWWPRWRWSRWSDIYQR